MWARETGPWTLTSPSSSPGACCQDTLSKPQFRPRLSPAQTALVSPLTPELNGHLALLPLYPDSFHCLPPTFPLPAQLSTPPWLHFSPRSVHCWETGTEGEPAIFHCKLLVSTSALSPAASQNLSFSSASLFWSLLLEYSPKAQNCHP